MSCSIDICPERLQKITKNLIQVSQSFDIQPWDFPRTKDEYQTTLQQHSGTFVCPAATRFQLSDGQQEYPGATLHTNIAFYVFPCRAELLQCFH